MPGHAEQDPADDSLLQQMVKDKISFPDGAEIDWKKSPMLYKKMAMMVNPTKYNRQFEPKDSIQCMSEATDLLLDYIDSLMI